MKRITIIPLLLIFLVSSCAVKVACVGDSITEGAGISRQSRDGYPVVLNQLLGKRYAVYWNCNEFSNVFAFKPDIIVIKLGTNDTKPYNWKLADFEKDYQALIDTFSTLKSKPRILLCKPVPAFKTKWGINDSTVVNGVIPAVERLAVRNNLQVVDLYGGLKNDGADFPDDIHPNEKAAAKMAEIIARALKNK
ncbi:MAG: putative O-antigen related protein [Bacteroidetes bacterium]|nr:putative O-antigen related protein [Bacteroidota bacterium]